MDREVEAKLIADCRLSAGAFPDDAGFRRLYAAFAPQVHKLVHRYSDAADANDIVQETFMKVWQGLAGFKHDCALSTWIHRIAINTARDRYRSQRRRSWLTLQQNAVDSHVDEATIGMAEHDAASDVEQRRRALLRAIGTLKPKLKDVIVLFSLQELELSAVAGILGVPVGTVKSRLHQARKILEQRLGAVRGELKKD